MWLGICEPRDSNAGHTGRDDNRLPGGNALTSSFPVLLYRSVVIGSHVVVRGLITLSHLRSWSW